MISSRRAAIGRSIGASSIVTHDGKPGSPPTSPAGVTPNARVEPGSTRAGASGLHAKAGRPRLRRLGAGAAQRLTSPFLLAHEPLDPGTLLIGATAPKEAVTVRGSRDGVHLDSDRGHRYERFLAVGGLERAYRGLEEWSRWRSTTPYLSLAAGRRLEGSQLPDHASLEVEQPLDC